jgi:hypothetical protein
MQVVIFASLMLGFSLARISYLNIGGDASSSYKKGAAPGEWYWYREGLARVGITIHLGCIIPAGVLMVVSRFRTLITLMLIMTCQWQFVPVIRHKFVLLHRINGYIVIVLVMISNAGTFLIIRRSFGGTLPTQAAMGLLVILSTTSISMAYYNIKRLQIEQHRAWMLRAMFYLGVIITTRIIMVIAAQVSTAVGKYYVPMICDEIVFVQDSLTHNNTMYPQCSIANMTVDGMIAVAANFGSDRREQLQASLELNFGMAAWLSVFLHTIGVEIYLNLTPAEGERLRRISYAKQLEAGMKNPGSAGLTVDRWGDADEWIMPAEDS